MTRLKGNIIGFCLGTFLWAVVLGIGLTVYNPVHAAPKLAEVAPFSIVSHTCTIIADDRNSLCDATCPIGNVAGAGGWNVSDDGLFTFQVQKSRQGSSSNLNPGDRWSLAVRAQDNGEHLQLTVYATCTLANPS